MEALTWFAYGFVCTSIGLIFGNRLAHRTMDKFIRETLARHHIELLRQIEEARDIALKQINKEG